MNIMKKGIFVAMSIFIAFVMQAQDSEGNSRLHHNVDLAISGVPSSQMVSLGYLQEFGIGKKQAWRLGYGVRLSGYFGNNITHVSAPPEFYNEDATRDSVWVSNPQMNNIALYIGASYVYKNMIEVGFNIDAVGYTFGGDKSATFISNANEATTTVNPGSVTALLIGPADIGMLKSEFFAAYKFNEKWKVRAGWVSLFTEYRTPTELQVGNTRYRGTAIQGLLAVTYTL